MDMQNVSNLQTPEGAVRTIHDKDNRLIWGRLNYDTKYAGDTVQDGTPTPDAPIPVQVVTGEQTVTVSDGVDSENFIISLGSIELCKIGGYQGRIYKSGNDWYVHKETKSFNLVDTTSWGRNANGRFYSTGWATDNGFEVAPGLCTHLIYSTTPWYGDGYFGITSSGNLWIDTGNAAITSGAEMNAWLATKLPVVYGVLKHTTDTRITDDTLIGQLNDVHEWLTRYGYSSTVAGDLPIIIDKTSL